MDRDGDIGQIDKREKQKVWCRWIMYAPLEGWEEQRPVWSKPEDLRVIPKAVADIVAKSIN